jgi:Fic family protein
VRPKSKRNIWDEVEQGLGSIGKLKILRVMLQNPNKAFTKYGLEKATKLKPVDVRTHLKTLTHLGWVTEYPYQPKTYKVTLENEIMNHLSEFFRRVKYL